jgi:hypothetical protein
MKAAKNWNMQLSAYGLYMALAFLSACLDMQAGVAFEPVGDDPTPIVSKGKLIANPPVVAIDPPTLPAFTACDLGGAEVKELWHHQTWSPAFNMTAHTSMAYLGFSTHPGLVAVGDGGTGEVFQHDFGQGPDQNPGGLVNQGGSVLYALSGTKAFDAPVLGRNGVDEGWNFVLRQHGNHQLKLHWLITGDTFLEIDPVELPAGAPDVPPYIRGVMTPSGGSLVVLDCFKHMSLANLRLIDLPTGETTLEIPVENFMCDVLFPRQSIIEPTHDGKGVILANGENAEILHVDLETGTIHRRDVTLTGTMDPASDGPSWQGLAIQDVAVHPEGDLLATTTGEGFIRLWTLPGLEEVGEPIPTAVEGINAMTYMPDVVSPVRWSPDGRFLIHVDKDKRIVLRNETDLEIVHAFERAPLVTEDTAWGELPHGWENAVLNFAFSKDSSAILVRTSHGVTAYGCAGWDIQGEGHDLQVLLEGPSTIKVGESVEFTATHIHGNDLHGHQFFANDVAISTMSMGRRVQWTPQKAGIFDITVLIDDGYNMGETTMEVRVE